MQEQCDNHMRISGELDIADNDRDFLQKVVEGDKTCTVPDVNTYCRSDHHWEPQSSSRITQKGRWWWKSFSAGRPSYAKSLFLRILWSTRCWCPSTGGSSPKCPCMTVPWHISHSSAAAVCQACYSDASPNTAFSWPHIMWFLHISIEEKLAVGLSVQGCSMPSKMALQVMCGGLSHG